MCACACVFASSVLATVPLIKARRVLHFAVYLEDCTCSAPCGLMFCRWWSLVVLVLALEALAKLEQGRRLYSQVGAGDERPRAIFGLPAHDSRTFRGDILNVMATGLWCSVCTRDTLMPRVDVARTSSLPFCMPRL